MKILGVILLIICINMYADRAFDSVSTGYCWKVLLFQKFVHDWHKMEQKNYIEISQALKNAWDVVKDKIPQHEQQDDQCFVKAERHIAFFTGIDCPQKKDEAVRGIIHEMNVVTGKWADEMYPESWKACHFVHRLVIWDDIKHMPQRVLRPWRIGR